jgi:hypothetical protein
LDILLSTGTGHARRTTSRTTIYAKTESTYLLKLKSSRAVFSEIQKKFGPFPFNVGGLDDEKRSRMGVQECKDHGLLVPYEVLYEKDGPSPVPLNLLSPLCPLCGAFGTVPFTVGRD